MATIAVSLDMSTLLEKSHLTEKGKAQIAVLVMSMVTRKPMLVKGRLLETGDGDIVYNTYPDGNIKVSMVVSAISAKDESGHNFIVEGYHTYDFTKSTSVKLFVAVDHDRF
jgi:maltose-binding protein MalE